LLATQTAKATDEIAAQIAPVQAIAQTVSHFMRTVQSVIVGIEGIASTIAAAAQGLRGDTGLLSDEVDRFVSKVRTAV
jgi:methyl-accepting chemotaxis protein